MENDLMSKKEKILGPREKHPYGEFIPEGASKILIGTFPVGKFTNPLRRDEINPDKDMDFFYGGSTNPFWKLIGECLGTKLNNKNEIIEALSSRHIAIGDVIKSCRRINGSASDNDLKEQEWNLNLLEVVRTAGIKELIFVSKTVEKWFRENIGEPVGLKTITLFSPSPQALIRVPSLPAFKEWQFNNPDGRPSAYRLYLYKKALLDL